jgi:DNA-binding transcriptional ArsR family regulator
MDVIDVGKALSNPTRVNILKLLCKSSFSASDLHKKYLDEFEDDKRRESVYRELEKLQKYGLVKKRYASDEKTLYYELISANLTVDLESSEVRINKG